MVLRSSNIRPDMARLWSSLMRSAEIGRTAKGGLKRLALSEEDGEVRREFVRWCEEAGCTVQVDGIGDRKSVV